LCMLATCIAHAGTCIALAGAWWSETRRAFALGPASLRC
jgi:hypothetical protein